MHDVEMNITEACKHVTDIERGICTLKERIRCVVSDLHVAGILYYHMWIIVHDVYFVTKMVNLFPSKLGMLQVYPPHAIVMGQTLDVKTELRAQFVLYIGICTSES